MCSRSVDIQGGSNTYLLDNLLTGIEAYYTIQMISNRCILNSKKKKKGIKNNITNGVVGVIGVTVALLAISVNGNGLC